MAIEAHEVDHATQLRLVPRSEYKSDFRLAFQKIAELSEKICEKEDRIRTIRVTGDELRNDNGQDK